MTARKGQTQAARCASGPRDHETPPTGRARLLPSRRALLRAITVGVFALTLFAASADAHQRSLSFSRWTIEDSTARVEFRIADLELTRFPPGMFQPEYLTTRLVLLRDGARCAPAPGVRRHSAADGWTVFEWTIPFEPGGELAVRSDAFLDVISTHQHFVRLQYAGSDTVSEMLLTENARVWPLGRRAAGASFAGYLRLGVEHILEGWDHLAFVIALLLVAVSLREVAVLVTGFTVAHSITLALAVLGLFKPAAPIVEIYVAFSIALVAVENLWWQAGSDRFAPATLAVVLLLGGVAALTGSGLLPTVAWAGLILFALAYFTALREVERPFRLRAVVTFAFGLVHGFGFAGVLMALGLPPGRTALGLFGFNLGVELGQVLVVLLAWPVLATLRRIANGRLHAPLTELASAGALASAVFWFTTRNWG